MYCHYMYKITRVDTGLGFGAQRKLEPKIWQADRQQHVSCTCLIYRRKIDSNDEVVSNAVELHGEIRVCGQHRDRSMGQMGLDL